MIFELLNFVHVYISNWASQMVLVVKNTPGNAGDIRDVDLIPGLGRSSRGGHSNPLQYFCLGCKFVYMCVCVCLCDCDGKKRGMDEQTA